MGPLIAAIDTTALTTSLTSAITQGEVIAGAGLAVVGFLIIVKVVKKALNRAT